MKPQLKSSLILLLTAIIWGFAFVAQYLGANHVGSFTFGGIRFTLGALSLIPVFYIFEGRAKDKAKLRKTVVSGILAGTVLFAAANLQQFGIVMTGDAGKSGFITGLYIVIVPLLGMLLGKKPTVLTLVSSVVAIGGLYLLCVGGGSQVGVGDLLLLIGAVCWAIHILVIDTVASDIYSLRFASVQFATCGFFSVICMFGFEEPNMSDIFAATGPILYAGLMSVGVAYTLQIIGQRDAEPTSAAIIMSTESVFSAIGGAIFLHQYMSLRGYVGCVLIFSAIIISQLNPKKLFRRKDKDNG